MMDVVPKRRTTTAALFLIIIVSLIMIISGSLEGAAAWANIIALPVAIISLVLMLRPVSGSTPATNGRGREPTSGPETPSGAAPAVQQIGFGGVRQANVAGNYYERGHDDREDR